MWWKNFNEGSIPGFNQWLLNCFNMCNVVSGLVVCVLFSTFVTGLTVESVSIYCACVSCIGKVVYVLLSMFLCAAFLWQQDLGTNILAKHHGITSHNYLNRRRRCQAREKPVYEGLTFEHLCSLIGQRMFHQFYDMTIRRWLSKVVTELQTKSEYVRLRKFWRQYFYPRDDDLYSSNSDSIANPIPERVNWW